MPVSARNMLVYLVTRLSWVPELFPIRCPLVLITLVVLLSAPRSSYPLGARRLKDLIGGNRMT